MSDLAVYFASFVLLSLLLVADRQRKSLQLSTFRLVAWLATAAVTASLIWTIGFCSILPHSGSVVPPEGRLGWEVCLYAGGLAAGVGLVGFLPLYTLLLLLYVYRFERENCAWGIPAKAMAAIALLLPLWVLNADLKFMPRAYGVAVPRAVMAFVAVYVGLIAPRLLPPLAPGNLVRATERPNDA